MCRFIDTNTAGNNVVKKLSKRSKPENQETSRQIQITRQKSQNEEAESQGQTHII